MINRDERDVTVYTYVTGVDQYGQVQKGNYITGTIKMACYISAQSNVADPRYVQVDVIGLTKDNVTNDNVLVIDSSQAQYQVKYVTPTPRYNIVGLVKKN